MAEGPALRLSGEKPAATASDCTTAENDDGKISEVNTIMQYRKSDTDKWEDCDGSEIAGLEPGTYYVRVNGTNWQLASESQELTIKSYITPIPTDFSVTVTTDDYGTASAVFGKSVSKAAEESRISGPTGTKVILTADPSEGYRFKRWKVLSGGVTITDNSFEIGTEDVFILALFEKDAEDTCQVTVSVSAGENGSAAIAAGSGGVPTLTATPNIGYRFKEWRFITGAVTLVDEHTFIFGNGNVDLQAVFEKSAEPVPPVPPKPKGMDFFLLEGELPLTGITTPKEELRPLSVNYKPVNMELMIPSLDITSEIVTVPQTDEGYPVEGLESDAGLLEGTALPGSGISVIAGHNTLDTEEYGPFAAIRLLKEGDHFFVRNVNGKLMTYEVYANEKIGSHDTGTLQKAAMTYDNTLTLLTCEDELPEGGYTSRRIVSARFIGE